MGVENVSVSTLFTLVQDTPPHLTSPLQHKPQHSKAPALSLLSEVSTNQHSVASRTQKLKTPCRSEQELSSFTDAEATNKL